LQRLSVSPVANIVWRVEEGINAAPPRALCAVELRDFEFQRLPIGIDDDMEQEP